MKGCFFISLMLLYIKIFILLGGSMGITITLSSIVVIVFFWSAECLAFPMFIRAQWPQKCVKSFCWKMISASLFLGYGVFAYLFAKNYLWGSSFSNKFAMYMLIGLACGWLGDLFLHLTALWKEPGKILTGASFGIGLVSFLVGHIFYVLAFIYAIGTTGHKLPYQVWIGVAAMLVLFLVGKLVSKIKLGIAAIPVALYAATISTMLVCALTFAVYYAKCSITASIVISVGAILFVVSDGTLVFNMFGNEKMKSNYPLKVVNLVTYFIGQMLLGSAIMLVSKGCL